MRALVRRPPSPALKPGVVAAEDEDVIAVFIRRNVELDGVRLPKDRVIDVVESLPDDALATPERQVVTIGEAEALVRLGVAEPVGGVASLEVVIERWRRE